MRKSIKKRISLLCAALLLFTSMSGCGASEPEDATPTGKVTQAVEVNEEEGKTVNKPEETTPTMSVVDYVKSNFVSSSLNETYNQPLYDLPENHTFSFECSKNAGYIAYDVFRVFDNPNYEDITGKSYCKCTYEDGRIIVEPRNVLYLNADGTSTGDDGTWGSMNQLYLVQYIDLFTGEALEKPIVTPFRVQHEVEAPVLTQWIDENNCYRLQWEAVPGAVEYRVYEHFGDVAYKLMHTTSNTSVSVEDFEEQKEIEELLDLFRKDLENAGYSPLVTDTEGVSYMNGAVQPKESLKNGYFLVIAVDAQGKQSGISNIVDVRELANKLPYTVTESVMKVEISSIEEVPAYVEVEMLDGSVQTMIIDYHGAKVYRDPENDMKMTIQAKVANTIFNQFIVILSGMKYDDIKAEASYITARQDELLSKVGGTMTTTVSVNHVPSQEAEEALKKSEPTEAPKPTEAPTEPTKQPIAEESLPMQVMYEVSAAVEQTMEELGKDKVETVLYGSNDLGAWMGLCLITQSKVIPVPVEMFPDAANLDYAVELLMESYRQNPTSGFLCDVGYSKEYQALVVKYLEEPEVRLEKTKQELEAAEKIANQLITDDMSDYDKVLAMNEYFRENASYDFDSTATEIEDFSQLSEQFIDSHSPYGIICKNYGVCESYSEAFILTARFAGVEAMCETGALYGGGHEWNRVKVDGSWCILDVTNNDQESCINGLFNVTDEQVKGILVPDDKALVDAQDYAAVDDTKEYYYVNGKSVTDLDEAAEMLMIQLETADTAELRVPSGATKKELEAVLKELVQENGIRLSKAGTKFNILCIEK